MYGQRIVFCEGRFFRPSMLFTDSKNVFSPHFSTVCVLSNDLGHFLKSLRVYFIFKSRYHQSESPGSVCSSISRSSDQFPIVSSNPVRKIVRVPNVSSITALRKEKVTY